MEDNELDLEALLDETTYDMPTGIGLAEDTPHMSDVSDLNPFRPRSFVLDRFYLFPGVDRGEHAQARSADGHHQKAPIRPCYFSLPFGGSRLVDAYSFLPPIIDVCALTHKTFNGRRLKGNHTKTQLSASDNKCQGKDDLAEAGCYAQSLVASRHHKQGI